MPIWELMMNSSRARPTPRFGIREKANAWCPDVHHDLDVDIGHCAHLGLFIRIVELARVDIAGVTFGARDRHRRAVGEFVCGASSTHHRGDAQLSRMIAAWQVRRLVSSRLHRRVS